MPAYAQRLTLLAERDLVLLSVPVLMLHAHRERTAAMQRALRLALAAEASRAELTARYIAYASYQSLLPSASIVFIAANPTNTDRQNQDVIASVTPALLRYGLIAWQHSPSPWVARLPRSRARPSSNHTRPG